jgi:hypothetical protein
MLAVRLNSFVSGPVVRFVSSSCLVEMTTPEDISRVHERMRVREREKKGLEMCFNDRFVSFRADAFGHMSFI